MSFWGELKRRNVVRVGIAYLAVAWLLIQVADTVLPNVGAPTWVIQALIFASALGFPVALLLAWLYDYTPEGIKPASEIAATKAVGFTGRRIDFVIIGVLVLAVGFLLVKPPGTEPIPLIPDSIAVLPLGNLSPEPENAFYALGIHDEIITQLRKIRNLTVIDRQSVMALAGDGRSPADIAADLRVESLLTGTLQYADGRIRLAVNLIDPPTGRIIWDREYRESFADIFEVQADLAMNVANELRVEFSTAEREEIGRWYTKSEDAHISYLAAQAANDPVRTLELIEEALEADPGFVDAWVRKGELHALFGEYDLAWEAIENAIDLSEGKYARPYPVRGLIRTFQGLWIEAEQYYLDAIEHGFEPYSLLGYPWLHRIVGRFDDAIAEAEAHLVVDPMSQFTAQGLLMAYEVVGDRDGWQRTFDRGKRLYSVWPAGYHGLLYALAERDHETLRSLARVASAGDSIGPHQKALIIGASNLDSPDSGMAALRELYADLNLNSIGPDNIFDRMAIFSLSAWAAFFGYTEQSFEWLAKSVPLGPIQVEYIWFPIFKAVRQEPGFKELLIELWLREYWNLYDWPTLCRKINEVDFECD